MTGIKIGNGAIIGAGSVVTKDVKPYTIVGGTPARLIRMRFDDATIKRLEKLQGWQYDLIGMNLPFADIQASLDQLEQHVATNPVFKPYAPLKYLVWREGEHIKARPEAVLT